MSNSQNIQPGAVVDLVEFGPPCMRAVVSRLSENGWEAEVEFPVRGDGARGGFDFWPVTELRVVNEAGCSRSSLWRRKATDGHSTGTD